MPKYFRILLMVTLFFVAVRLEAAEITDKLWLEIYNENFYSHTNFEVKEQWYNDERVDVNGFYLTNFGSDFGVRFTITDNLFFDPLMGLQFLRDWGNEEWNDLSYYNNWKWGFGGRLRYEYKNDNDVKLRPIWVESFSLALKAGYWFQENSIDSSKNDIGQEQPERDLENENFVVEITSWSSFGTDKYIGETTRFWFEIWGKLDYQTTGFHDRGNGNFYGLLLDPKIGIDWEFYKFSIQPYFGLNIAYDFGSHDWNKYPWRNTYEYGPGVRLSLGEKFLKLKGASIHVYTEYLNNGYFSKADIENHNYIENARDYDYRMGIELWLPFGATKESLIRY